MEVKEQIQQTRTQIEQRRQQLEQERQSLPKPTLKQLLGRDKKVGLQQMIFQKKMLKPKRELQIASQELMGVESQFEQDVASKAPEYGREDLVNKEYERTKKILDDKIQEQKTKIAELEARKVDITKDGISSGEGKQLDKIDKSISEYEAKITGYSRAYGDKPTTIKNVNTGYADEMADYEYQKAYSRNQAYEKFNELKKKEDFKNILEKVGLASKPSVSFSEFEKAVNKYNQGIEYEKQLVSYASEKGYETLPIELQQQLIKRDLVSFGEDNLISGGTKTNIPTSYGQPIITKEEASKIGGDTSKFLVTPEIKTERDILESASVERKPYFTLKEVSSISGVPTYKEVLMYPSEEREDISLGGGIGGKAPIWYEKEVEVESTPTGRFLKVEGYEPTFVPNVLTASDKPISEFKKFTQPVVGFGKKVYTSYLGMEEELASRTTEPLGFWVKEKTKGTSIGGETGLTFERARQNIEEKTFWVKEKIKGLRWLPESDKKFLIGATTFVAEPFAFGAVRATEFAQKKPLLTATAGPALYYAGATLGLGFTLGSAGATAISPALGAVTQGGIIGYGLTTGITQGASIYGRYKKASGRERGDILFYEVAPAAISIAGISKGAKIGQRLITNPIEYSSFGKREYVKTFNYSPKIKSEVIQMGRKAIVQPSPIQKFFGVKEPIYKGIYGKDVLGYQRAVKLLKIQGFTETGAKQAIALRSPKFRVTNFFGGGKMVSLRTDNLGRTLGLTKEEISFVEGKVDLSGKYVTLAKDIKQIYKPNPYKPKIKTEKGTLIFKSSQITEKEGIDFLSGKKIKSMKDTGLIPKILTESKGVFVGEPKVSSLRGGKVEVTSRDIKLINAKGEFEFSLPKEKALEYKPTLNLKDLTIRGDVKSRAIDFGKIVSKKEVISLGKVKKVSFELEKNYAPKFIKSKLPQVGTGLGDVKIKVLDMETKPGKFKVGKFGEGKGKLSLFKDVEVTKTKAITTLRTSSVPETIKVKGYTTSGKKIPAYTRKYRGVKDIKDISAFKDITYSIEELPSGEGPKIFRPPKPSSRNVLEIYQKVKEPITQSTVKSSLKAVQSLRGVSSPKITPTEISPPIRSLTISKGKTIGTTPIIIKAQKAQMVLSQVGNVQNQMKLRKVPTSEYLVQKQIKPMALITLKKLQQQRLQPQRLQFQRLQTQRLQFQKLQPQRLQFQKIQVQKLQQQRLQLQQIQFQRLQQQRLQTQKLGLAFMLTKSNLSKSKVSPVIPRPPKKLLILGTPQVSDNLKNLFKVKKVNGEKAFTVEIRRRGKFLPTGVSLGKEEAIAYGIKKTLGGASASFRLKETKQRKGFLGVGSVSRLTELFGLSKSKRETPLTFIQLKTKRILTPGEKREISLLGGRPRTIERRSR